MPTLKGSPLARIVTLCALYCAQGMPWGFVTVTLLAYLGERGMSLDETAEIVGLATLPWSFKIVWGLVIDRFTFRPMGRRRPWVLAAQLCMGITLLAMILQGDIADDVRLLAWMVFLHNCFVSLQDVASDALAVDVLEPGERGRVNGLMWASSYLGVIIGGAGMGTVLSRFGVQAAFVLQASVLVAIALLPLLLRERAGERLLPWTRGEPGSDDDEAALSQSVSGLVRTLWGAFRARAPFLGLLFALTSYLMVGVLVAVNPIFCTQEVGWSQEDYSQIVGGWGSGLGIAGALVGGFLVDRLGVGRIVTVTTTLAVVICFGMAAFPEQRTSQGVVLVYLLGTSFLTSAQTVAGYSLFMRLCNVAVAGTQFTLYMAMANLTRVIGAWIVGAVGERGYSLLFAIMGAALLLALPFLYAIPGSWRPVKAVEA